MPDSLKDENGKAYAYRDADGNYYELNYGLTYDSQEYPETPVTPERPVTPSKPGSGSCGNGGSDGSSSKYVTSTSDDGDWVMDSKGWWFKFNDGTWPEGKWMKLYWNGRSDWYHFGADGYMQVGWLEEDGYRYYLHGVSDGTMGHMYIGWHLIDGNWYYFNEVSDGTMGRLLVNTTTPDGYHVDANGVWVQ